MIEALYNQYFHDVFLYLKAVTRSDDLAEELTQETFFKALQSIDGFRGESSVQTWLCSIARNRFLSEQRKKKPEELETLAEQSDGAAGPEERAIERAESLRLHRAIHELPEPYREVFSLRVFAQLGFREIGALFGKTDNWACVVYHRARDQIRKKEDTP